MIIAILFTFIRSQKQIYICNKFCHSLCPPDSFIANNSFSDFKDYLLSRIRNEKEIDLYFYSYHDEFTFEIESKYFGDMKVRMKTFYDSKPIKLYIKEDNNPVYKIIELKADSQLIWPDLITSKFPKNDNEKRILENPESTPVPISIGLSSMNIVGSFGCDPSSFDIDPGCNIDDLESEYAYKCGYRCWSDQATFSYKFKGVKFQIYGTYDLNHGKFDIKIDDVFLHEIDLKRSRGEYKLIYTSDLLEYKEHTVDMIGKGEAFELFKLSYWPSLKAKRLNSTDFIKMEGNWEKKTDKIGGVYEYCENGKAKVEIKCNKFWLYGVRDINVSTINISYYGVSEIIDPYSRFTKLNYLIFESTGLPYYADSIIISSDLLALHCLYYEDPQLVTETPYPTHTIDPLGPTPNATPIPTPIPLSVGLFQMNRSGNIGCADGYNISDLDENSLKNYCDIEFLDDPPAYYCGIRCWSDDANFTYTFKGVKFEIYGTLDIAHGNFSVIVDDGESIIVNQYRSYRKTYAILYTSNTLNYGEHTVRIVSLGETYELYKIAYYPHLKAKRVNITEFIKTGTWKKDSDLIGGAREYTNHTDSTATKTIYCSKFWVYGNKNDCISMNELRYNGKIINLCENTYFEENDSSIIEYNSLLYESPELPYGPYKLTFISKGILDLSCVYYADDLPIRTQAPEPSRTPIQESYDEYIDKEFTEILPNYQIYVSESSIINQISGCKFYRISENYDYFIILEKTIDIFDNIFEFSDDQIDAPAPFHILFNNHITIKNCTFINSKCRKYSGNVLYCCKEYAITANFESCTFINCGNSKSESIINIENYFSSLILNNCSFSFENSEKSSRITDVSCSDVQIIGCEFIKCGSIEAYIRTIHGIFEYKNNTASYFTQKILYVLNLKTNPIFTDNIFKHSFIDDKYLLYLYHNQDELFFENNTFCNLSSIQNDNQCKGGLAMKIPKTDNTYGNITFNKCKFYDNGNNHNADLVFENGGALQLGYDFTFENFSFQLNECEFRRNECTNGGALVINYALIISLLNCIFEYNSALQNGGAIYIACSENEMNQFRMDLIEIIGCNFINNVASIDAAISIQTDNIGIETININSTSFIDCVSNEYCMSFQNIQYLFINDCSFIYSNTENSCASLNIDSPNIISINKCTFEKNNNKNKDESGCLFIHRNNGNISQIDINNILFDSCAGSSYNAIFINCNCDNFDTIYNLTINNVQDNSYIFGFYINHDLIFEKCTFNNCTSINGGGCGSKLIPLNKITFNECIWSNNFCTNSGGAFQYGNDPQFDEIVIEFNKCNFTNNKTPKFGGALLIQTNQNLIIDRCMFNNNIAGITDSSELPENENGFGGALMIQINGSCHIQNCTFEGNHAKELGGAVFIEPKSNIENNPIVELKSIEFIYNTVDENYGSALFITGEEVSFFISNISFINNGKNESVFYSNSSSIIFENSSFETNDPSIQSKALEMNAHGMLSIQFISFNGFKCENNILDGSGIKIISQSNNEKLEEFNISNCTFINCRSNGKGGSIYANNIQKLLIINSTFNGCSGNGAVIYVDTDVQEFEFDFNEMINMNDLENFMIVSGASNFEFLNRKIEKTSNNLIKGFKFISGKNVLLQDLTIEGLTAGILVEKYVENILISNCNFIDCQYNKDSEFVVEINNQYCEFKNNSILYTNQDFIGNAINITGYGNIEILHNKFINCQAKSNICLASSSDINNGIINFNYNLIQGFTGNQISLFNINYDKENINFDHNIINECNIWLDQNTENNAYLSQIINIQSEFQIANLSFKNIKVNSISNELFSCLFSFKQSQNTDNKIKMIYCSFINNEHESGNGGAFRIGNMLSQFEIDFEMCNFINNSAKSSGGALSFSGDILIAINNCTFDNNEANNGGAIQIIDDINEKSIEINNCTFQKNKSLYNGGAFSIISIKNIKIKNCLFAENIGNYFHQLNYWINLEDWEEHYL